MLRRIKFAQLLAQQQQPGRLGSLPSVKYNAAAGTHTGEKTSSIHCITFLPLAEEYQNQHAKKRSLSLTLLHKAYLEGEEGRENRTVVNGSLGRSQFSFLPTAQRFATFPILAFPPVQHHLHVVPHIRVPILVDGETSRGVEQLDMHDSNLRRERSKLNDEGRGRKQNNIQVLFNS